jgi:hypothetical protein
MGPGVDAVYIEARAHDDRRHLLAAIAGVEVPPLSSCEEMPESDRGGVSVFGAMTEW